MKPSKLTLLLTSLVLVTGITLHAQEKFSRIKIPFDSGNPVAQRNFVYGALQIDHCHFEDNSYVVEIGARELARLKASSFRYEVLVDDVAENFRLTSDVSKFYESDNAAHRPNFVTSCMQVANILPTPSQFTPGAMGGYYTYAEMVTKMGWLIDNFPSIVDTFSIGITGEGRDIWCIKISDNVGVDENEPEVSFNGLQHAREAIAGTSLIFLAQYLVQNYASNTKVQQMVNNREIFIIPCTNPDGYVYNQTTNPAGGGQWRKNRRPLGGGEFGVDLNRNYNVDWGNCSPPIGGVVANCGDPSPTSNNATYWGTGPFSEPETRAIRDFTAAHNFMMSIDQHSEGAYNTTPNGRQGLHPVLPALDSTFLYAVSSSIMATYDCHRIGNNLQTLNYEVAGGNKDWMFHGQTSMAVNPRKVYSFTSEAGGGSFWPAAAQIIPLSKGLCFQDIQAILTAGSYADIQDVNDANLPAGLTGNMNYLVRRIGIIDAPITVSLIPLQNIASAGAPVTIPSIAVYNATVSGSIAYTLHPLVTAGQVVKFIWRVTTDGITTNDTVSKIYNPVPVFYDDMETVASFATNWTASAGWAYSNVLAYAGTRAITESPGAGVNYPQNTTRTLTCNIPIDLSNATAAYLSFWTRHRSENCMDFLRIQFSTNGGASYTNLCGQLTISETSGLLGGQPALTGIRENWTRELINLAPFMGAGNNNCRLRFSFSSNADDPTDPYYKEQDDGFYLDNVRVIKSISTLVTLPVKFLKFEGKLIGNGRAELTWEAETDAMHDHFEIERSGDRSSYISLGRTVAAPPYSFIDGSLLIGNNYYRVKQVDKDGRINYSNVINIFYKPGQVNMIVYPNPVTDYLKIKINSVRTEEYTVQIADLAGKIVHQEKVTVSSVPRDLNINFTSQAAQIYVLTVRNSNNEVINTQKIVKK